MRQFDRLMAEALPIAAQLLAHSSPASSFREEYLEQAIIEAIKQIRPEASATAAGHGRVSIPNWDRELGGFDVRIRLEDQSEEAFVEAKVDDVDQTLWDLFKLAAALSMSGVKACYLLVARHKHRWDDGDCTALFTEGSAPVRWNSVAMFEDWKSAWAALLKGGTARPTSIPTEIETVFVGKAPAQGFDSYEIRCVSVHLISGAGTVDFENDWPAPGNPT